MKGRESMVSLKEIEAFLEERFPPQYKEDYDNIGHLAGFSDIRTENVLLCLDVTADVVREAAARGARIIISHHPVIFSGVKSITDETPAGEALLLSAKLGMGIYSAHTNADSAPNGLTDFIVKKLGLKTVGTLTGSLGRICVPNTKISASQLCSRIKKEFFVKHLYSTLKEDRPVEKIAVVNGGGGGDTALLAAECGADIYISGDLKHHEHMLFSSLQGIDFIEMRHYDSEFCITQLLKEALKSRFKDDLGVFISEKNKNPLIDTDNIL